MDHGSKASSATEAVEERERPELPPISVVIPSVRRGPILADTLRDVSRQWDIEFECLLVMQIKLPQDEINELYSLLPGRVRIYEHDVASASAARNIGLLVARYPIVLFLDDDVSIGDPGFFAHHSQNFSDTTVSGVVGQVLEVGETTTATPDVSEKPLAIGWRYLRPSYSQRCRTLDGRSNNLSVRREWAVAVGGMDLWFTRAARREETEFNLRYTKKYGAYVFDPLASLVHLSADGGSRSWGRVSAGTVPMHDIVGHWYFLLCALRNRTLTAQVTWQELRLIAIALLKNPQIDKSPARLVVNLARAVAGLVVASARFVQGPRRIDRMQKSSFRLVEQSNRSEGVAPREKLSLE